MLNVDSSTKYTDPAKMAARPETVDELFEIKNYFYIGNYQQCINEAQKLRKPSTPEVAIQRDIFTYRSYIAQNKFLVVLDEISDASPSQIKPIKQLAEYFQSKAKREQVVTELEAQISKGVSCDCLALVAAQIFLNEGKMEGAFRVLQTSNCLEALALTVYILLLINRVELAKKKLEAMQEKDDDATLTQLAQAWIYVTIGGEKLRDAYYIFQELMDKYGSTSMLLNGQALTFIGDAKYEEAEGALQEALEKDAGYPDTLVNLIVLGRHFGKPAEITNRYLSQLKDAHNGYEFTQEYKKKEAEFGRICAQYGPTKRTIPV